jgi:predicted dehydrogenase
MSERSAGPRLAVVGAGANIWPFHERAVQAAGFTLAAVYDVAVERARPVGERLGCPVAGSLSELLAVDCDAVTVLAPHRQHYELVKDALAAGRHVLVEKPVAVTVEEARDLGTAAAGAGRLLGVCLQQRTRTELVRARQLVRDGAIGEVQRADLLGIWPRRTGYFGTAPWRGTWAGEGGGILINQGQHDLDALCFVAGQPSAVFAATRTAVHPTETEDTAAALLEWPNGALGSVHLSSAELDEPQRIEVTGTAGRLCVRPGRLEMWRNDADFREFARAPGDPYTPMGATAEPAFAGSGGRHEEIYINFRDALAEGAPLVADAASATGTLELAAAILIAAHAGTRTTLPLPAGAHTDLLAELTRRASHVPR